MFRLLHRHACGAIVRDSSGRILLVDPTYKPDWDLPGRMAEANEPPEQARDAVEALLGRRAPTDVIVCLTGRRTVAVHSVLASRGLAIPGDIGFLTMDDFSWAPALGITVIAQPAYQMGQKAAELIVENPGRPARLTFEPQLIARTSCGENR